MLRRSAVAKKADWIDGDRGRMAGMMLFNRVPTGTNKVMRVLRLELNNCTEKKTFYGKL